MPGMSLEEIVELLTTNTYQFQQEIEMRIRRMEDRICLLASTVRQLVSPICKNCPHRPLSTLRKMGV